MIPLNIRFWYLIHDSAEKVWHWVWRTKLGPYHQKLWNAKKPDPVIYTKIAETEEVTIYRSIPR